MKKITLQLCVLFLFTISVKGQDSVSNVGNFKIYAGASVTISGNFTNSSAGALENNGSLYIKRNINNSQASMTTGTGSLYLNGTDSQTINGAQKFKTYNLITNNSSGIILNNDLSVSGAHTFTGGVIITSATPNYLIYEAGSSYSGDGDTRHVNGWVKKNGATDFIFPVGNGMVERTIALASLSASSEFNVRYNLVTPNPGAFLPPLILMDSAEYWTVSKVAGGTAYANMNWNNNKVLFPSWPLANVAVANYDGTNWTDAGGTASGNSTAGNITSNIISSFNKLGFGYREIPLPLDLLSFTANRITNHTNLVWITANEQNVDHFNIERSNDGRYFYTIGQTPARNSGNLETYSAIDYNPINHIAYYRLASVDIDGKQKLSKIVAVTAGSGSDNIRLLSNPIENEIVLVANPSVAGTFNYFISSIDGKLQQKGVLVIQNGGQYELPLLKSMKPGSYLLLLKNALQSFQYILIKK